MEMGKLTAKLRDAVPVCLLVDGKEIKMAVWTKPQQEPVTQDELPPEIVPASVAEAFAQALEDAQAAGEPVADIAAAMADGEAIKAKIIDEGEGRLVVITVEPEGTVAMPEATEATAEAEAQPEDNEPTKKPARKGKGKKGAAATEDESK